MDELTTIQFLNTKYGTSLSLSEDRFSSYDAEDFNYIAEIKNRREYYSDKLIECYKLFGNYQKAQLKGKMFIYVVTDERGVYIFNITKNIDRIVARKPIPFDCPATTDFNRNNRLTKYSYTLTEDMAIKELF